MISKKDKREQLRVERRSYSQWMCQRRRRGVMRHGRCWYS